MTATMAVYCDVGGSDDSPGTSQSVSTSGAPAIRLKTNDDLAVDKNNPIPIPSNGEQYNRSFWRHVYLYCSAAPDTQIDNVKFYTDGGGFGTGVNLWVGDETPTKNSGSDAGYAVAVGTVGESGTPMTSHPDITGTTDAFSYTSASPKSVSISESGNVIDAQGETTDYLVFQMAVASNASSGDLPDETMTYMYDEI